MDNISTGRLVDEIAQRTGLAKGDVQKAVDALGETIVETLARGGRVELSGLASFTVEEKAPRLWRNPRTGRTTVVPVTRRIRVRMSQAVKRRVAADTLATGSGLYVGAADDPWMAETKQQLAEIGYEVATGESFAAALASSRQRPAQLSFVMVGPSIADGAYAELARALKLDPSSAMLPIVRGRSEHDDVSRPSTVQVVPDDEFDSPETAAELVRDEAERWREEKFFFGRQVTLKSPSDAASVESLKRMLEGFYRDALADETEAYKTLSAFRESIDNAAMHGNGNRADKMLAVTLMQDDERLALDVKDEGSGFDFEARLGTSTGSDAASVARERLGRGSAGGLGMRLMHECVDEVRYGDGGTRVTLLKRRRRARTKPFEDSVP
jgi:DNA-binding protein HU-beta